MTYAVTAMHSTRQDDGTYKYGGLKPAELSLQRRYKLQILSVSHYHTDEVNALHTFDNYGPNSMLQSIAKLQEFLRWGATQRTTTMNFAMERTTIFLQLTFLRHNGLIWR